MKRSAGALSACAQHELAGLHVARLQDAQDQLDDPALDRGVGHQQSHDDILQVQRSIDRGALTNRAPGASVPAQVGLLHQIVLDHEGPSAVLENAAPQRSMRRLPGFLRECRGLGHAVIMARRPLGRQRGQLLSRESVFTSGCVGSARR